MQVSNQSNINFNGAFRVKPNEIKAKADIPELFTQGKQVFHDILEKGDQVIILRDKYDKRVGKYIQENNLSGIEYYPEINTKCGLDDEQPEGLLALINSKTKVIKEDIKEILTAITQQKRTPKAPKTPKAYKEAEKIANTLRLNIEAPQITSNKSFTKIRDEHKKRTIEVIMPNKGTIYAHVIPDSMCESSTKCILDGKGKIVKSFETPNEIHKFNVLFRKLKKENVNIIE